MSNNSRVVGYLLFNEIEVENANALSGNLIYGTPSITGIKGAFHALSRSFLKEGKIALRGVLVACHDLKVLASRSENHKNYRFLQLRQGIMKKADYESVYKKGAAPSITESAYCYMKMSFVVEVVCDHDLDAKEKQALTEAAYNRIQRQRIAGGSVRLFKDKSKVAFIEYEDLAAVTYRMSDAYVLTDATDELRGLACDHPEKTPLDILIGICSTTYTPNQVEDKTIWTSKRLGAGLGWLVPMTIGYQSIAKTFDASNIKNSRVGADSDTKSTYVESVYGLGKWVNPHKLRLDNELIDAFWYYQHKPENSLYLVTTKLN